MGGFDGIEPLVHRALLGRAREAADGGDDSLGGRRLRALVEVFSMNAILAFANACGALAFPPANGLCANVNFLSDTYEAAILN